MHSILEPRRRARVVPRRRLLGSRALRAAAAGDQERAASTRPRRASACGGSAGRLTGGEIARHAQREHAWRSAACGTSYASSTHIEEGKFQAVDFHRGVHLPGRLHQRPAPDRGALRGAPPLHPRPGARHRAERRAASAVEEKVRALFHEHFFDLEDAIRARPFRRATAEPRAGDPASGKRRNACGPGCRAWTARRAAPRTARRWRRTSIAGEADDERLCVPASSSNWRRR